MSYTGGEYSIETLFEELREQVRMENVRTFEAYLGLIDVLIEEKESYGFLADEEDLQQIKNDLETRWPQVEANLAV